MPQRTGPLVRGALEALVSDGELDVVLKRFVEDGHQRLRAACRRRQHLERGRGAASYLLHVGLLEIGVAEVVLDVLRVALARLWLGRLRSIDRGGQRRCSAPRGRRTRCRRPSTPDR